MSKFYVGSEYAPYRCVIICGFGISHTEEKSSYVSIHSYLILFLQCQVFDRKNINSWKKQKKEPSQHYQIISQTPQVFDFFLEKALQQWKTTKEFLPFFFFKVRKRPSWNPLQKHGACPFQVRQEDHQKCPGCIKRSSNAGATRSLPLFLWWPHGTFVPWNPPAFVTNLLSQAACDYFQYFMNRGSLCSASLSSCGWCFCLPDEFPPFLM